MYNLSLIVERNLDRRLLADRFASVDQGLIVTGLLAARAVFALTRKFTKVSPN